MINFHDQINLYNLDKQWRVTNLGFLESNGKIHITVQVTEVWESGRILDSVLTVPGERASRAHGREGAILKSNCHQIEFSKHQFI